MEEELENSNAEESTVNNTEELPPQAEESTDTRDIIERELTKSEEPKEEVAPTEPPKDQPILKSPFSAWKREAQAELDKLPANVQNYIIERESQFHKGIEQYKAAASAAKEWEKASAPHNDYLQQLGVQPQVAFNHLLKTEKTLRTGSQSEKVEMIQKFITDYGIDINQVLSTPYDANASRLKDQLEFTKSQLQDAQYFQQSIEEQQIQSFIDHFSQDKEYFNDTRLIMADLLEKGLATDLDDAYNKAIRLNDDVFSKVQAQQQTSLKHQELNQANQAAKQARQAAVQVKGALASSVKHNVTPKSTEEAVRMAMAQHGL